MREMDGHDGPERRSGEDGRRDSDRRNGLAVLMAGCSQCGRIAPSPFEMQLEGWEIVYDEQGLVSITCPAHLAHAASDDELPDYLIRPDEAG